MTCHASFNYLSDCQDRRSLTKAPVEREVLKELVASLRPADSSSQNEIWLGYWALGTGQMPRWD